MITKAIVKNVDYTGNKCLVRIPLFESASSTSQVEVTALINIPPGIFNNLYPGDIVFVGFEENAIEKPIILGKLYRGPDFEINARGGNGNFDHLKVFTSASIPSSTLFVYPAELEEIYKEYNTPKLLADGIMKTINLINRLSEHHELDMEKVRLFLQPWNLEIDDGDLDITNNDAIIPKQVNGVGKPIDLISSAPPTLYNHDPNLTEEDWPLKLSPNKEITFDLENDILEKTDGKSKYIKATDKKSIKKT